MARLLKWLAPACLLGVAGLVTGCLTPLPPPARSHTARAEPERASSHYRIQPGDFLMVTFFGEPDYTQQVRVDWNGQINLPYLAGGGRSEIAAAGLSPSELAAGISKYARENQILANPRAQVVVVESVNQTFVLLGQVNQPGRYAFPRGVQPHIDLMGAIALGGGYTRLARQSLIVVKRGEQVFRLNSKQLAMKPGRGDFDILPGDVITVPERIF